MPYLWIHANVLNKQVYAQNHRRQRCNNVRVQSNRSSQMHSAKYIEKLSVVE